MRTTLIGLLSVTALLCSGTALGQTTLRAWNIHPEGYPVTEAFKSFVEDVSKTTSGKYRIDLSNNGVLGDQPKALQMFKDGSIDVAEFNAGPLSDAAPGLQAFNLPFLFSDSAHMFRHLDGAVGDRLAAKLKGWLRRAGLVRRGCTLVLLRQQADDANPGFRRPEHSRPEGRDLHRDGEVVGGNAGRRALQGRARPVGAEED
jgi:TRAP-type C4-dicarboxylate transport system substrate-binding protein